MSTETLRVFVRFAEGSWPLGQQRQMFLGRSPSTNSCPTHTAGESPAVLPGLWCGSRSPASAGTDTSTWGFAQEPLGRGLGTHCAAVEPSTLIPLLRLARLFEDTTLPCLASHRIKVIPSPKTIWARCRVCSGCRQAQDTGPCLLNSHCGHSVPVTDSHVCPHQRRSRQP